MLKNHGRNYVFEVFEALDNFHGKNALQLKVKDSSVKLQGISQSIRFRPPYSDWTETFRLARSKKYMLQANDCMFPNLSLFTFKS